MHNTNGLRATALATVQAAALAAALALGAGAAQAVTVAPANTLSLMAPASQSQPLRALRWDSGDVTLSLDQFNPSQGTLTSVTLQLSGTLNASYDFTSAASTSQQVTGRLANPTMLFQVPGNLPLALSFLGGQMQATLGAGDFLDGEAVASGERTEVLTTGLNAFIGSGQFDIGVLADAAWTFSGTAALDPSGAALTGSAQVQVRYGFTPAATPVPEPASLALAGLALCAAGLVRRQRRA